MQNANTGDKGVTSSVTNSMQETDENVKEEYSEAASKEKVNKLSIGRIVGADGHDYGIGVRLDSDLLIGLNEKDRRTMVKEYIKELGGASFSAFNESGSEVRIKIAKKNDRFKNRRGKKVWVNKDLVDKNRNATKQEAVVLVDELIDTAIFDGTNHQSIRMNGWITMVRTIGNIGQHICRIRETPFGKQH